MGASLMPLKRAVLVFGFALLMALAAATAWWIARDSRPVAERNISTLCLRPGGRRTRVAQGPLLYVRGPRSAPVPGGGARANRVWSAGTVRTFAVEVKNRCGGARGPGAWLSAVRATTIRSSPLARDIEVEVLAPDPRRPGHLVGVARGPLTRFLARPVPLALPGRGGPLPIAPGQTERLYLRVRMTATGHGAGASEVADFAVMSLPR